MKIFGKIKRQEFARELLCDIAGGLIYAVGIYAFAGPADFAPGGISGVALILNRIFGVPVGLTILILNIPLIALSWRTVGKRFIFKTARSMIFCTLFTDAVLPHFPVYDGNIMLAAVYAGAFIGGGIAFFYMHGSSSGGTDLLIMSVKSKRPYLSVGTVTMIVDLIIILLGWPVFGDINAVLYGLISTVASSTVIDKVLYGLGGGKLVTIITTKGEKTAENIALKCRRGSTICRGTGAYTGEKRQVLFCACSKAEAYKVRAAAYDTDRESFVMISDISEVFGRGFSDPEVRKN